MQTFFENMVLHTERRIAYKPGICHYHRLYYMNPETNKSVCSLCWKGIDAKSECRFIVPASVREILVQSGYSVDIIPEHSQNCPLFHDRSRFELLYPQHGLKLFIPRDYDGAHERVVFTAKHQDSSTHLFWYLNKSFIGETVYVHQLSIELDSGFHHLLVQDEAGFIQEVSFTVYKKDV